MRTLLLTHHPDYGGVGRIMIPADNIAYAKDTNKGTQIFFKRVTFAETTVMVKESAWEINEQMKELK